MFFMFRHRNLAPARLTSSIVRDHRYRPHCACYRLSANEEEMEKRLTAAAISAKPIVNLNNLTSDLESEMLCADRHR